MGLYMGYTLWKSKPFTICGMHILAGLYTKDFPLMLTYSSATLRRLKDSMSELHDHFWRENYKFPQFLSQNCQEPPNWLENGWVEGKRD